MSLEEPLVLREGTEVSAKYKGAFCEARIKKIDRNVKCKVSLKRGSAVVTISEKDLIDYQGGDPKVGDSARAYYAAGSSANVSAAGTVEGTISKVLDQSLYTVVFDDGDEATLKRTSLCLKSGKHYAESETLDQLPLSHPEHFGIPVNLGRRRRRPNVAALLHTPLQQSRASPKPSASTSAAASSKKSITTTATATTSAPSHSDSDDSEEEKLPHFTLKRTSTRRNADFCRVVIVDYSDKRVIKNKDSWFPALVGEFNENISTSLINPKAEKDEYTVRSFRDGRFYNVSKKDAREFHKEKNRSYMNSAECSTELRTAIMKALLFLEQNVLPENWDTATIRSTEDTEDSVDTNEDESSNSRDMASRGGGGHGVRRNLNKKFEEEEDEDEEDEDEDEMSDSEIEVGEEEEDEEKREKARRQHEERDLFVAQLYKFMDERGTPINNSPSVNGKELNLYKLHRVVTKMGGPNRVTNQKRWKRVYNRLGLGHHTADEDAESTSAPATSTTFSYDKDSDEDSEDGINRADSPVSQLKKVYTKYLHPFYDLNRKLGSTPCLGDLRRNISRPSRGERKREEERSRVNSTSSVSSTISTPTNSSVLTLRTGKFGAGSTITSKQQQQSTKSGKSVTAVDAQSIGSLDSSPPPSSTTTMVTASEAVSTTASTSTAKEVGKASKGKAEDKKRRKKDFDSDSNDQQQREKQMAIKREDTEDDSQMTGPSSIMEGESSDEGSSSNKVEKVDESEIAIGDGLKVKYGRGKQLKVYEAKVLKSEYDVTKNRYKYLVHYYGWSSRYDEWIYRNRIVQVIRDKSPRRRSGKVKNKGEPLPVDANICIDDEDGDEDNKIEVVVRSHTKSESSMSNIRSSRGLLQPLPNEPPPPEKRSRVKDEPKQERSASMSLVDVTGRGGRTRTASFSLKETTTSATKEQQQSAKKEKVSAIKAEADAGGRGPTISGPGSSSKRAKVQSSQASASKEKDVAKSSSKMQIKKSDSDDESSRMVSTPKGSSTSKSKDKKKTPAEKTVKQVDTPATRKDGKRTESNKRTAAETSILAPDVSKEDSALEAVGSFLKKRRTDEAATTSTSKSSTPQSKASITAAADDAYEFVDDDEEHKEASVGMGRLASTKSGGMMGELHKKETGKRERPQSADVADGAGNSRLEKSSKKAKTAAAAASTSAALQPELEEEKPTSTKSDEKEKETRTEPSGRSTAAAASTESSSRVKSESPCTENASATTSTTPSTTTTMEQLKGGDGSYHMIADTLNAADSSGADDQEVEKILAKTEAQKSSEAEVKAETEAAAEGGDKVAADGGKGSLEVAAAEQGTQEEADDDDDDDMDRSPMGLVVAEDEEEEKADSKSLSSDIKDEDEAASRDGPSSTTKDNEEEVEKNAVISGGGTKASEETKADSLLLCEEALPASPPSSPTPPTISGQAPEPSSSMHHPAVNQTTTSTTDYYRSQMLAGSHSATAESASHRIGPFSGKLGEAGAASQEGIGGKQSMPHVTPFNAKPAFLANLHRNSGQLSAPPPPPLNHPPTSQPFSQLLAAAASQSSTSTTSMAKPTTAKSTKTLNVIVPPNIASNIMKMDTSRARLSREEQELAENFADDEGVTGMEIDDDDDDNDSDADSKRYARKVEPPVVASARKRRAIRSESKVSSSSSPVAAGILSSQDSSQDGDDHSIDEELQKMVAEEKKLRSKAAAAASAKCSDLDSKNDDDSMSGSQSRLANRDPSDSKSFKSPAPSPKKRRRGRMRTISQSENRDGGGTSGTPYSERKERSLGYRTRGRYRHNVGHLSHSDLDRYGSSGYLSGRGNASSSLYDTANMYSTGGGSSASCSSSNIQAIIANLKAPDPMPFDYSIFAAYDQNKYPYMAPLDVEKMPPEQRINILLERMEYVRKTYFDVKAKMVETERKKKRALQKKKDRERKEQRELAKAANAAAAALANLQASGSDSSSSSSKNERSSRSSTRQRDNGGTASGRSSARLEEAAAAGSDGGSKNKEESPT